MPSLNFKQQFVTLIKTGEKRRTIRKLRKRPFRVNDSLYLFTGMRTKNCKRIGQFVCLLIEDIEIEQHQILIDDKKLKAWQINKLAVADGFKNTDEFLTFFKKQHTLPFKGQIIHW